MAKRIYKSELFKQIVSYLHNDNRFKYIGRSCCFGVLFESDFINLDAPCSGENLDCAKYRIHVKVDNAHGVETHIEMNAVTINEWETVFWGTCPSLQFFYSLIFDALGIPKLHDDKNLPLNDGSTQ